VIDFACVSIDLEISNMSSHLKLVHRHSLLYLMSGKPPWLVRNDFKVVGWWIKKDAKNDKNELFFYLSMM
jgi:hypothetical protein